MSLGGQYSENSCLRLLESEQRQGDFGGKGKLRSSQHEMFPIHYRLALRVATDLHVVAQTLVESPPSLCLAVPSKKLRTVSFLESKEETPEERKPLHLLSLISSQQSSS